MSEATAVRKALKVYKDWIQVIETKTVMRKSKNCDSLMVCVDRWQKVWINNVWHNYEQTLHTVCEVPTEAATSEVEGRHENADNSHLIDKNTN